MESLIFWHNFSYFNRFEIDVVGNYVRKLVNRKFGRHLVREDDIGIITPYRKQVGTFALKALAHRKRTVPGNRNCPSPQSAFC